MQIVRASIKAYIRLDDIQSMIKSTGIYRDIYIEERDSRQRLSI